MPSATVDSGDTTIKLFYTDTGPVESDDYTTLFIYHGYAFTGHTFSKLLPLVPSSNIRLVIVTRRDYGSFDSPRSTPHSDSELEDLRACREIFLERLGLTVANFLLWFIDTNKTPKISNDRKSGGISVVGWSLGGVNPLALLGHPDVLSKESQKKLASYFRQTILYDPAEANFGFNFGPDPDIYHTSFGDFATFVTAYYLNPDLTSRAGASSTTVDSSKRSSLQNMTDEDLAVNLDLGASMKSDVLLLTTMLPALEKQAQAALFDEALAKEFLPGMEVVWIACPQSMWPLEWSKVLIARQYEEHVKQERHIRLIRFTEIEGANHFVHWDGPQKFWDTIIDIVCNAG